MKHVNYWLGVFTGTGRGFRFNNDFKMIYFSRFQWNIFGRELPFSGGDLDISEKSASLIAITGITNPSLYTRLSSS